MNTLFIHKDFPGKFYHLARMLAANPDNRVVAIGQPHAQGHPDIKHLLTYTPRYNQTQSAQYSLRELEEAILNGRAVAQLLLRLKKSGFVPDIVVADSSWGEALYVKDIFPAIPLLSRFEFYYRADENFDPEYPLQLDDRLRLRTRNSLDLLNLEACDAGFCPSTWQKSLYPPQFRPKISVVCEGIDTVNIAPNPGQKFHLPNGIVLTRADEVVTCVARNLDPYHGVQILMRAVGEICRRRPQTRVIIVGEENAGEIRTLRERQSFPKRLLQKVAIDPRRVHFLGQLSHPEYLALLQISSVHVHLTVPFTPSRSMLEAMAAGCLVLGSSFLPAHEVITHGENGLLVNSFSPMQIADSVDEIFAHPDRMHRLREEARKSITARNRMPQSLVSQLELINATILQHRETIAEEKNARLDEPINPPTLGRTQPAAPVIRIAHPNGPLPQAAVLSHRELEILRHLILGKSDKAISIQLQISVKTVNHHVCSILQKLEANNRAHAVAKALKERVIEMHPAQVGSKNH